MDSKLHIIIKTMDNKAAEVHFEPSSTISALKDHLESQLKIPQDRQRLIYQGKVLENQKTLTEYKIQDGHVILLAAHSVPENPPSVQPQQQQSQSNADPGFDLEIISHILRQLNHSQISRQTLRRMLFQQRGNGFQIDRVQSYEGIRQNNQTVRQLMDTRVSLQEIDHEDVTFINPFNLKTRKFKVGQWIDLKDTIDQWLEAQVLIVEENRIFVHYNGWGRRWDEWIQTDSPRIATFRTYTVGMHRSDFMSPSPSNDPDAELQLPQIDTAEIAMEAGKLMEETALMMYEFARLQKQKKIKEQQLQTQLQCLCLTKDGDITQNRHLLQQQREIRKLGQKESLISSQLAPICDRVGRMMMDIAPNMAISGQSTQRIHPASEDGPMYMFQVPIILTPNELQMQQLQAPTVHSRVEILSSRLAILRMTETVTSNLESDEE